MMPKQVKPHQVVSRIEALVKEQKQNGYKPGWVWHQMTRLVDKKWDNIFIYSYPGSESYLPDAAQSIAEGGDWEGILERMNDDYRQYQEMTD